MERYIYSLLLKDSARPRSFFALALVPALLSWISGERLRPLGCNQFRTVRRKPVEREEKSGKREEERSRSQEGLTDTWPLNGANLRAPAVTLLIR